MSNPKPCPFCGAEARRWNYTVAQVYCCSNRACGASSHLWPVDSWNHRHGEKAAIRTGTLEFIKRVEVEAAARVASDDFDDPPYTYAIATAEVFDQLAFEFKRL